MTLTEEERKKIEEEEYRKEARGQFNSRNEPKKKKGVGCFTAIIIVVVSIGIMSAIISSKVPSTPPTEIKSNINKNIEIKVFPAKEILTKTEEQIRKDFADLMTCYQEGHITPSGKIRITSFDMGSTNVQVDYEVNTNKPHYIGYSFVNQLLPEAKAWQTTGFSKPASRPQSHSGIMGRTVMSWENTSDIKPFKLVQLIYDEGGLVGKIAFSLEDLATAQSSKSLYYIR